MSRAPIYRLAFLGLVGALSACGGKDSTSPPPPSVSSVRVSLATTALMSGMQTSATATAAAANGTTITGRTASWKSETPGVATVDQNGNVQAVGAGTSAIVATIDGKDGRATVTVVAKPSCASSAISLSVGQSRLLSGAERDAVCVPEGSYSLIALSNSLVPSSQTQVEIAGSGLFATGSGSSALANQIPVALPLGMSEVSGVRVDLNAHVRRLSDFSAPSGPIYSRSSSVSGAAAFPPKVGDSYPLYAIGGVSSSVSCTQRPLIGARVAAVSKHAVIVTDTLNPAGGYTDADYAAFASDFDSKVFPSDSANFSPPLNQQQLVIFFTREVNRETPPGAANGSILGYFWGPDLDPPTSCPTTNGLEMFYLRVPDPEGTVNTNKVTKAQAQPSLLGTLAHEMQHLINREQRRAKGVPLEDVWMNEGLSTIAQELLFYRMSGLSSKQRITSTMLRQSTQVSDAFNQVLRSEFGNLSGYLAAPETHSFFQQGSPLPTQTYGSVMQFLRFAMDRTTQDQSAAWRSIEVAPTTGLSTVAAVFGDPKTLIRDYATAQVLSDLGTGAPATQRFLSWDYRDVYLNFIGATKYALHTQPLGDGSSSTLTLIGGGSAFFTLDVAAGGIGSAKVTSQSLPIPAGVDLVLVRTR